MVYAERGDLIGRFLHDCRGATAIEYALIASGIGATIAATVWNLGAGIKANLYDKLTSIF